VDVLFILDATASMRWGKGTWHCMRWRGDMALHEVVQEGMAARRGEGTRHCMRWRGDKALHVVGRGFGTA